MLIQKVPGYDNLYLDENGTPYSYLGGQYIEVSVSYSSTYPRVSITDKGKKKRENLHVLMAITFLSLDRTLLGVQNHSLQIDHLDGNKQNNAISNLQIVTKSENYKRAYSQGRYANNGKNGKGKAKLSLRMFSPCEIEAIKQLRSDGMSYRRIAKEYNCSHSTIYQIVNGISYGDTADYQ